jgi:hypothetical protein
MPRIVNRLNMAAGYPATLEVTVMDCNVDDGKSNISIVGWLMLGLALWEAVLLLFTLLRMV